MKKLFLIIILSSLSFAQSSLLTLMSDDALILPVTANLQFDFDMDYATTASVIDLSGNNRTMTFYDTVTVNTAGINSKYKTVTFDGSDDYGKISAFTSNQPVTLYIVVKGITLTSNKRIADGNGLNSNLVSIQAGNAWGIYAGSAYITSATEDNLVQGGWCLLTCVYNGASSIAQRNNGTAKSGSIGTSGAGGFTLAADGNNASQSNIEVARVLRYAGAHDEATRTLIKAYLNKKYAIY